jgi:uncharacterized membrane protein (UPF0127 family)
MVDAMNRRALIAALLLAAQAEFARAQLRAPSFERSFLVIESGANKHRFDIELADTDERRAYGLMHRDRMAPDAGMLFDFKTDQPVAMWMRNTRIPLDMLFIAANGRVVNIRERAVPHDETSIYSDGPVRSVLELNGGTVTRLGIKPGDVVRHRMFGNPP